MHVIRKYNKLLVLAVLMLGIVFVASVVSADSFGEREELPTPEKRIGVSDGRNLDLATVDWDSGWYDTSGSSTVCFEVFNDQSGGGASDGWITDVEITLPVGWTVSCNTQDAFDSVFSPVSMSCSTASNVVSYADDDGGFGEINEQETWGFCVDVTVPGATSGNANFDYKLDDDYDETKSDTSATTIPPAPPIPDTTGLPDIFQNYCVPLSEADMQTLLEATWTTTSVTTTHAEVSIVAISDGTIIYWDHWEDGLDTTPDAPTTNTTVIWGDGEYSNGAPQGCFANSCDVLNAGDVIRATDNISLPAGGPIKYDGGDCFGASAPINVTRSGWGNNGTVHAGAAEVIPVESWDVEYTIPVGEDFSGVGEQFQYVGIGIMSATDGNDCSIDYNDGVPSPDYTVTLNRGESWFTPSDSDDVQLGSSVDCDDPVQVNTVTGDIDPTDGWETRWQVQIPAPSLGNAYYAPVGSLEYPGGSGNYCDGGGDEDLIWQDFATVILYNPNGSAIDIDVTDNGGTTVVAVAANSYEVVELGFNTGTGFVSQGGEDFYATLSANANEPELVITSCDSGGDAYANAGTSTFDWGASLQPVLGTNYVVGLGDAYYLPDGASGSSSCGSVVYATAPTATDVYVDFDQDGTPDAPYAPIALTAYGSLELSDATDHDMSGARVYTTDGTEISLVYGENPVCAGSGNPYLDLGTGILPQPEALASTGKTASIFYDESPMTDPLASPDDVLEYVIRIDSLGTLAVFNVWIEDTVPQYTTYEPGNANKPNITEYSADCNTGWTIIPDNGSTPFPLDEGGYPVGNLLSSEKACIRFYVTVNEASALPGDLEFINNTAEIRTDNAGTTQPSVATPIDPDTPTTVALRNSHTGGVDNIALFSLVAAMALLTVTMVSVLKQRERRYQ